MTAPRRPTPAQRRVLASLARGAQLIRYPTYTLGGRIAWAVDSGVIGDPSRSVPAPTAEAIEAAGWASVVETRGRRSRYAITPAGRAVLEVAP